MKAPSRLNETPEVLWKGKDIAVVYKPPQWICETTKNSPNPWSSFDAMRASRKTGQRRMEMHWWLELEFPRHAGIFRSTADDHGLCHRLDRETSGALLVALSVEALRRMKGHIRDHSVHKAYLCLANGIVKHATVSMPLQPGGNKDHQTIPSHEGGKSATTDVQPLAQLARGGSDYTLCRCEIYEGRTHQIRAHMTYDLRAPLVADDLYPHRVREHADHDFCNRLFLHAYALAFPYEDRWMCVVCPLAMDLRGALGQLSFKSINSARVWTSLKNEGVLNADDETSVAPSEMALGALAHFQWKLSMRRMKKVPKSLHLLLPLSPMLRSTPEAIAELRPVAHGTDRPCSPILKKRPASGMDRSEPPPLKRVRTN